MTILRALPDNQSAAPLAVSQAFCRLMLQISLAAIPVYLGLFILAVPFDVDAGKLKGMAISFPAFVFLLAAAIYAVGFLATGPDAKRESLEAIASSQRPIIRLKMKMILMGSAVFIFGVATVTLLLIKAHL